MAVSEKRINCPTCQYTCLCLPKKQVNRLTATLALLSIIVFATGYYVGKRSAAQELLFQMQQECLVPNQQLFSTFQEIQHLTSGKESNNLVSPGESIDLICTATSDIVSNPSKPIDRWSAQLAGFGTYKAALHCAERLKKSGIETKIVKRESRSDKKMIYWYQVISKPFNNKGELEQLVAMISQKEHIKGAKIVKV